MNKPLLLIKTIAVVAIVLAAGQLAIAGIYSGPQDTTHAIDPAISSSSPLLVEWADGIDPDRTYFAPRGSTEISYTSFNCLGDLDAEQIAAGDSPGYITVTFPHGICDGSGYDFAAFENGFIVSGTNYVFMELAYVEVSSDGSNFARFPSISLSEGPAWGSGAFAGYDVSNVFNLAGKHASGYGTQFDLSDLLDDDLVLSGAVDLDNIQYVKLVDIPGNGSYLDSQGNPILDNWMTGGTGGFDFVIGRGVAVINAVPEPSTIVLLLTAVVTCGACASRRLRLIN